ncbi:MAG TPA: phosphatase PAP2 family protein [Caulobacteraceae bacterium]
MTYVRIFAAAAAAVVLGAGGYALSQSAPTPGYLSEPMDGAALIGPPPADGSAKDLAEKGHYAQTRGLAGSPRWAQARFDAELTAAALGRGFGCAAGIEMSPQETPALYRVLGRVGGDIRSNIRAPKDHYQRARPAVGNTTPICVERSAALMGDGSYPSGHAMLGWTYALLLAELKPNEAEAILQRGKDFGDSRVICGVHYASDVEAGRTLASALVARLHAEPQFVADMAAARAELAGAKPAADCPTPAG